MSGMLSHKDIIDAITSREIAIAPFSPKSEDERLTPAGFNFSFTNFVISLNKKELYPLHENEYGEIYFELEKGDSALALTRETIWVSGKYAGTFHSKVGFAAKGLGQISTTLDPGWKGQLLISINNPNANDVKVVIGQRINDIICYKTFITLCLYELKTPATKRSDNTSGRLEIILGILQEDYEKNSRLIKQVTGLMQKERELTTKYGLVFDLDPPKQDTYEHFVEAHNEILAMLEKIAPKIKKDSTKTEVVN